MVAATSRSSPITQCGSLTASVSMEMEESLEAKAEALVSALVNVFPDEDPLEILATRQRRIFYAHTRPTHNIVEA